MVEPEPQDKKKEVLADLANKANEVEKVEKWLKTLTPEEKERFNTASGGQLIH